MIPWYRDRASLALIGGRYLPLLAGLNLGWEIAQLPLYTLWRESSASYMAFAVAHCTIGDIFIGAAALAIALTATRAGPLASWRWRTVVGLTTLLGLAYTAASEWMNTSLRPAWQYSELMPVVALVGLRIGVSPLAQWLLLPPLALSIARKARR